MGAHERNGAGTKDNGEGIVKARFREEEVCLSREVFRLLKVIARTANSDRDDGASYVTVDECADNMLRKVILSDFPQLAELYPEYEKAANASKKLYEDAEAKMIEAVRAARVMGAV